MLSGVTKKRIKQINARIQAQKRLILLFGVVVALFAALAFRIGWITVIANDTYAAMAADRQTKDEITPAARGAILDRNMKELVIGASSYNIWIRPDNLASGDTEKLRRANFESAVNMLSEELGMDAEAVREMATRDKTLVKVAKDVDKEVMTRIRTRAREEELTGIETEENTGRYYPYGAFAAHVLGIVSDDGKGLGGIELAYDRDLTGVPGRRIMQTDRAGDSLAYGEETIYPKRDGLNVVLTIDETIQHYAEKAIRGVAEKTSANRVMVIVMSPKTGDVLAMAVTPDFDPGDPRRAPDEATEAYIKGLSAEEQVNYWSGIWRNPLVSDVYDPGSTFKLLTVASALEERVTHPDDGFYCNGYTQVVSNTLRCWRYYDPHRAETLTTAVSNSCNPVMIELARRMGTEKFYRYIELFGITDKTGIDYPGEGKALIQSRDEAGPVGLATMSFGQGISVTPIQLITAVSAIGNEGKLMRPRLVKALADADGNIVRDFKPEVVRQVISEQTAEEVKTIMEYVVEGSGGGKEARVPGYRVGGKTGTAEKLDNGSYKTGKVTASMVAMAPINDPEISVLLIVDEPKGEKFGSITAAPGVRDILRDTLRYLNIRPDEAAGSAAPRANITVPNVTGMRLGDAAVKLTGSNLTYVVSPATEDAAEFTVVDQYPKAGEKLAAGEQVCLYGE